MTHAALSPLIGAEFDAFLCAPNFAGMARRPGLLVEPRPARLGLAGTAVRLSDQPRRDGVAQ
jgi:hypothetical protein